VKNARAKALSCCAVAIAFLAGVTGSHAESFSATFPGPSSEVASPDGRLRVVNHDPDGSEGRHSLLLKKGTSNQEKVLHEYARHVSVAWSPSSKYLTITDYAESTDATCYLYDVQSGTKVDLGREAERSSKPIAHLMANGHAYFACARWLSPSRILIKVSAWGRNASSGKDEVFEYTIGNGFKRVRADRR
jgi:hypothetical protein